MYNVPLGDHVVGKNSTFTSQKQSSLKEIKVKASRFNFFVDLDKGRKLMFNAVSGALVELTPETHAQVTDILTSAGPHSTSSNQELAGQLEYGGFLVGDDVDEVVELRVTDVHRRFSNSLFSLGICPTFECNLACPYCDGRKMRGRMTRAVEKALVRFTDFHVRKCDLIELIWFGGEPLLCLETIERIQAGIGEQAEKYGVQLLGSTVVTNGTLLDGDTAARLKAAGVSTVQITIDGPAASHDSSRSLDDGAGSYERVIENISNCVGILDVIVRVNTDGRDAAMIGKTIDDLGGRGLLAQNRMYLGASRSRSAVCADVMGRCCLTEKQTATLLGLYRSLVNNVNCRIDFPYLTPRGPCGLDSVTSILVAPTGYLFKSWEDIAPNVEKSIGSPFAGEVESFQQANLWPYLSRDPFYTQECRECAALPVCLGTCLPSDLTTVAGSCSPWKSFLQDLVTLRYQFSKREEVIE